MNHSYALKNNVVTSVWNKHCLLYNISWCPSSLIAKFQSLWLVATPLANTRQKLPKFTESTMIHWQSLVAFFAAKTWIADNMQVWGFHRHASPGNSRRWLEENLHVLWVSVGIEIHMFTPRFDTSFKGSERELWSDNCQSVRHSCIQGTCNLHFIYRCNKWKPQESAGKLGIEIIKAVIADTAPVSAEVWFDLELATPATAASNQTNPSFSSFYWKLVMIVRTARARGTI